MADLNTITSINLFKIEALTYANDWFMNLINGALQGSTESLINIGIILIVGIILLFILYKVSKLFFALVKRLFIFIIVLGFVAAFFMNFYENIFTQQDPIFIVLGVVGVVTALFALVMSLLSVQSRARRAFGRDKIAEIKESLEDQLTKEQRKELKKKAKVEAVPSISPTQAQQPKIFTHGALTTKDLFSSFTDRSILSVFAFIVVAEFGVFSSVTISAPDSLVGIAFFGAFMLAAFIFIKSSYHSYKTGISHLFIGTVFAFGLSVILGHVWTQIPLETLLSIEYFSTNSLVATVVGLAVSLFMGSKE